MNQTALSGIITVLLAVGACGDTGGTDGATGACTNASDSEAIASYMLKSSSG
jgi:hypothetical protein